MLYRFLALSLGLLAACASLKPTARFDPPAGPAVLPREEAPHPHNSLEWWYVTGHLRDQATGEQFGVEYVFFHFNTHDGRRDYQMVNVALTDPQGQQFRYDYALGRLPRPLPDSLPLRLRDGRGEQAWTFAGQQGAYHLQARLRSAAGAGYGLDLTTRPTQPALLHEGTGYAHYGPGLAAGYYSYPRLAATGTLLVAGRPHQVAGELWYDRQWNCISVVAKGVGWDWLSIQLDEPHVELMLSTVRDRATGQRLLNGTYATADSTGRHLTGADFALTPLSYWRSPRSGRRYPAAWRVQVPAQGYDLRVEPLVPNQELGLRFFRAFTLYYWEGMCRVTGTHHGRPVTGTAYVEITNPHEAKKVKKELAPGTAAAQ